jgi:hypothetical protein
MTTSFNRVAIALCTTVASLCLATAVQVSAQAPAQAPPSPPPALGTPAAMMASMRGIGNAARRVKAATLNIINDVEQTKLTATPNDPLILDPPDNNRKDDVVWGEQMKQMGALEQPKKDWIDTDMSHLEKAVLLLNSEFSFTAFGDKKDATMRSWTAMNGVLSDINTHFELLQKLTAGPTYDNLEIGKAALRIRDDVTKLGKPYADTLKVVQQ